MKAMMAGERRRLILKEAARIAGAASGQMLAASAGFAAAGASLAGGMTPFGLSLLAAVPFRFAFASAGGAFLSYFLLLLRGGEFRYLASLTAILLIRLVVRRMTSREKNALIASVTAFGVSAGTALVASSGGFTGTVSAVCEALLCAGGAYFIFIATHRGDRTGMSVAELSGTAVSAAILLMGLYTVKIAEISVGSVIGVVLLLCVSRYGRASSGAIAGTVMGISVALCGGGLMPALCCAAGGLLCGVAAPLGKLAAAVVLITAGFTSAFFDGMSPEMTKLLIEFLCGTVIFMILPRSVLSRGAALIAPPSEMPELDGLRRTVVMRLEFASGALCGVSKTIEEIGERLSLRDKPDFGRVLKAVELDACRGCAICTHCWESAKAETVEAMIAMSDALKHSRPIEMADLPIGFAERCLRRERVENALAVYYGEYSSALAAEQRITEMREVVSDQFAGISEMLEDLAVEVDRAQSYDTEMASRVASVLTGLGIHASSCACVADKYGRISIEIRLSSAPPMPISRARILAALESVCERSLETPTVTRSGSEYYITVCEKALLAVEYAVESRSCKGGKICGDSSSCFYDGRGHMVMIISDGMGTGGRAAVDLAMATGLMGQLLRSGFGYDCSLRIVNSAMLFKSTDESLATIDIAAVDLFTGTAELHKAGAAPTLIRRNGRVGRAECKCLPAGILREVGFDRAIVTLRPGDIILMMSDGAVTDGTDWICEELACWRDGTAEQLAERIADGARRRRSDGHEDDITVIAAIIDKAV